MDSTTEGIYDDAMYLDFNVWCERNLESLTNIQSGFLHQFRSYELDIGIKGSDVSQPYMQSKRLSKFSSETNQKSTSTSVRPKKSSYKQIDPDIDELNHNKRKRTKHNKSHNRGALHCFNNIKRTLRQTSIDHFIRRHMRVFMKVKKINSLPKNDMKLATVKKIFKLHTETYYKNPEIQRLANKLVESVEAVDIETEFMCIGSKQNEFNNTDIRELFSNPNIQELFKITCKLASYELLKEIHSKLEHDPEKQQNYQKFLELFYRDSDS